MADNVVGISIVAHLDAFRAELAKIPDIGGKEARDLTAALAKEIKSAEKAARDSAKASQQAAKSGKDMGDAFGKAGSNAAKLAGAFDMLVPGAGNLVRSIADLADVGEVASGVTGMLGGSSTMLLGILGPLAVAVGAVGYATYEYDQRQQALSDRSAEYIQALSGIRAGYDDIRDALDELETREGVLSGVLSLEDVDAMRAQSAAEKVFASQRGRVVDELQVQADRLAALQAQQGGERSLIATLFGAGSAELASEQSVVKSRMEELSGTLADLDQQQGGYAERLGEVTTGERKAKEATQAGAEAKRDAAAAAREVAAALKEYEDQLHAEEAAGAASRKSYDDAITKLGELAAADRVAGMTAAERLVIEHEGAVQQIELLAQQASAAAETATARENIEAETLAAMRAENQRYYDEITKLRQADVAAEQAAAAARAAAVRESAFSVASDLTGAISQVADAVSTMAEDGTEQQKKLALVSFRVSQGAAIAQTLITTAKASMDAYAAALLLGPPGLVLAPIAAGAAAATGAAQVAAIAAQEPPKFHAGMAPDEYPATLRRGEGVLSGAGVRSAGGPEAVRDMNAGRAPAGVQTVVVKHNHQYFDAAIAENVRTGGALNRLKAKVGHRKRTP